MELRNDFVAPGGAAVGGFAGYWAGQKLASSQTAQDVASTIGSVNGQDNVKLPVINKYVAAFQARKIARDLLEGQEMHPALRATLVDGLATHLAVEARDPNKIVQGVLDVTNGVMNTGASTVAKKFPQHADNLDEMVKQAGKVSAFFTENGIQVVNATLGARAGRGLLGAGAFVVGGAGAVAGGLLASHYLGKD